MEAENSMGRAVEVLKSQANGKSSSANGDVVGTRDDGDRIAVRERALFPGFFDH